MHVAFDSGTLRAPTGPLDLVSVATGSTPGLEHASHPKRAGQQALSRLGPELADLQERLYAEGQSGGRRSVLLVLQGMDTSGKGGTVKHTVGLVDPQGVRVTSFKAPTEEELAHDFLWRIRRGLPEPGQIGVFDRSHYEDVLIAKVRELVDAEEIERRYAAINDFEADLVAGGTVVVKCFLHIGVAEQESRLRRRLLRVDKHWKYDPGDIDERELWPAYRHAYEAALHRTNTEVAPWYVVPSDHKWYRNLAVGLLLRDALRRMGPQWPVGDFDPEAELARLDAEGPLG